MPKRSYRRLREEDRHIIYRMRKAGNNEIMLLMFEMGSRELYFEISDQRSDLHPFVLVDVTSPAETGR